jgi:hypothetical protein
LAVGATVAQAQVFAGADTQKLYWKTFDTGSVPVNVAPPTYNGSGGQFYGYFGTDGLAEDFFRFFCADLGEYATTAGVDYTRTALNFTTTEARQLTWLFSAYYPNPTPPGGNDWQQGRNSSVFGKFTDAAVDSVNYTAAQRSGAMQLAVWEVLFEKNESSFGLDLIDGSFTGNFSDSAAKGLAQAMLTYVNGQDLALAPTSKWQFYLFTNRGAQDYIAADFGNFDRNLPLPGTLALLGLGLAGLGLARRKS